MEKETVYEKIDYFRMVAAILVVAIHTSPLLTIHATGDFILTRILARVAVPFFFMATGFFLFGKNAADRDMVRKRVYRFLHKTLLLYLIAIILYLPLNLYMGYFKDNFTFLSFLKDIFFNGTIYHLWYLPAAVAGCIIVWICMNRFRVKESLLITFLLYLIGIFGDSYYKWAEASFIGFPIYKFLFQLFDYTRNGIFFAPIFFFMGALAGKQKFKLKPKACWILFTVSIALMVCEGLLLHFSHMQRHDSMYFMLLPSMYFLFQLLLSENKDTKRTAMFHTKDLRDISMIVYIIHPWVIIGVRMTAKIVGLTKVFVVNSMIHFICVSIVSLLFGVIFVAVSKSGRNLYIRKKHKCT